MAIRISITTCSTHRAGICLPLALAALLATARATPPQLREMPSGAQPLGIRPDYTSLIIPPNIAPLNFAITEPGRRFFVKLWAASGTPIEIQSRNPRVLIPEKPWRALLAQNTPGKLFVEVCVQADDGRWKRFATITNHIAKEAVDPILLYRKIHPTHNSWREMGLYQRELQTFKETAVLENRRFDYDCCHCHSLRNNSPDNAIILIRSTEYHHSLLVLSNGVARAIQGLVGFSAWHPSAPVVASAFGKPRLLLHSAKPNDMRDIAELESWLGYFVLGQETVKRVPAADDTRLASSPAWAPDGKYLYYCSAANPLAAPGADIYTSYAGAQYDLMRLSYDAARDQWGKPEVVLRASTLGRSVAQPRVSPDGRWVFFCGTAFGCWPTYDPGSDLYSVDLTSSPGPEEFAFRKLELNSSECESWVSWSSNARWVVFSSKREGPLFNRPHLAYVSADGLCGKPFILPQEDPFYYDSQLKTYTIPTLATGPITIPQRELLKAIKAKQKSVLKVPDATTEQPGYLH